MPLESSQANDQGYAQFNSTQSSCWIKPPRRLTACRKPAAALCYLPPYSPDFNPIEQCSAQLKQKLRKLKARSVSTLEHALAQALSAVTLHHISHCFRHCGDGLR